MDSILLTNSWFKLITLATRKLLTVETSKPRVAFSPYMNRSMVLHPLENVLACLRAFRWPAFSLR